MKRTDHILAIATSLLHAPDVDFKRLVEVVNQTYVLDHPRKPGAVSLGVHDSTSQVTFLDWLLRLRHEKIQAINVFYEPLVDLQGMPPHVAAAFAGVTDLRLQIRTALSTSTYTIDTFFAPQYAMSLDNFMMLLNGQQNSEVFWDRTAELILQSNTLNGRSTFAPAETRDYLQSVEGAQVFENLLADLINEVQIEAAVQDITFVIPQSLLPFFVKYDSPYIADDEREYVYLYSLREVHASELLALVKAQPFGAAVWEELNRLLQEHNFSTIAMRPASEWEAELQKMSQEDLEVVAHPLLRAICVLCENEGTKPTIPKSLDTAFGPSEIDQKRAAARSKGKDRWSLKPNPNTWEYYAFRIQDYPIINDIKSFGDTRNKLITDLQKIKQFAASINSSFEESFASSLFFLHTSTAQDSSKKDYVAKLAAQMREAGMSEHAATNLSHVEWIVEFGHSLDWDTDHIHSMLAVTFADVFGGMGSWNDQYVEMDQALFNKLSAELFEAMKHHFSATLSSK